MFIANLWKSLTKRNSVREIEIKVSILENSRFTTNNFLNVRKTIFDFSHARWFANPILKCQFRREAKIDLRKNREREREIEFFYISFIYDINAKTSIFARNQLSKTIPRWRIIDLDPFPSCLCHGQGILLRAETEHAVVSDEITAT